MTILAMDYYLKALPIFERNGWMESVSTLYYNVGEMYQEMGNQEESRKNFEKSLDAALQSGDSLCMSLARYGLATVLLNEGMSQEAVKMEEQSLGYYLNHAEEEAASLMNGYVLMAHIFWEGLKDMPQAQLYMDKALAISQGMDTDLADAFSTQAGLFLARKEWKQCIDWCMRSLEKNDQDPHHNIGVYKMLAEAYASVGNTDESTRYLDLLYSTMETMANEQHQRALSEMEVRYETQQKEAQIEQMQQRQRMMWWIGALVFLIMAILFVTMWRIGHQRRKVLAVESKLTGEREERQRLARDLHDRVSGMLTATRLTLEQNHNDEALHLLQQASAEVRMVAHHLMPDSLTRQGLEVALRDYCQALTGVTFVCLGTPRRLSEHMETLCYSVIHELINNALRHAKASKIQVQLMFDKESISAIVADNGKGFDADVTQTGTGLRNIRERISSVGGNFTLTSTISQGTEAHFEIYI